MAQPNLTRRASSHAGEHTGLHIRTQTPGTLTPSGQPQQLVIQLAHHPKDDPTGIPRQLGEAVARELHHLEQPTPTRHQLSLIRKHLEIAPPKGDS